MPEDQANCDEIKMVLHSEPVFQKSLIALVIQSLRLYNSVILITNQLQIRPLIVNSTTI